jgi:hypothetical protein
MPTLRTILTTAALGVLAAPAVAVAGRGQSATYLPTMRPPAASPVAIHGTSPKAFV